MVVIQLRAWLMKQLGPIAETDLSFPPPLRGRHERNASLGGLISATETSLLWEDRMSGTLRFLFQPPYNKPAGGYTLCTRLKTTGNL